jgi:hypothetical protein
MLGEEKLGEERPGERSFTHLVLGSGQREIVEDLSAIIAEKSGLEEIPLRGFFWRSLKQWQKDHRSPASVVRQMDPEERVDAAFEIFRNFRDLVSPTLDDDEVRERFSAAVDEAHQAYVGKYSGIPDDGIPDDGIPDDGIPDDG